MRRRHVLRGGALAGLGAALAGVPRAGARTTTDADGSRGIAVPSGTALELRNRHGAVAVGTHAGDRVLVDATRRSVGEGDPAATGVRVARRGGRRVLAVEYGPGADPAGVAVDLSVRVPEGTRLARVETDRGDVTVRGTAGDLTARTGRGEVTVEGVDGFVDLRADAGAVRAAGVGGVDAATVGRGDVDVSVPALRDDAEVAAGNGDVALGVGPDLNADLRARAGAGSVSVTGLPVGEAGAGAVSAPLGAAAHDLRARTGTGDVHLRPA